MNSQDSETARDLRIKDVTRGEAIEVTINGETAHGFRGETIGGLMAAMGLRQIRRIDGHTPRGLYCGMGLCHGCLVSVDGQANVRACVTPIESGQKIDTQDGLGRFDTQTPPPSRQTVEHRTVPLAIIGGGPAGLSAALAAARAGVDVLLVDSEPQLGGQIHRQLPVTFQVRDPAPGGADDAEGRSLVRQVLNMPDRITVWNDAVVWARFEPRELAVARPNTLTLLDARTIIVATGAYDRPVPVPGWTLPGVMTAGGAQTLLKTQRVRPGRRVLLAGTGPLQLILANQLLDADVEVVAVAEAAPARGALRHLPDLLRQPALLKRAAQYLRRLKRAKVPLLHRHVLQSIHGKDQVERVVLIEVDERWNAVPAATKSYEVDAICIGYGFIPRTSVTRLLGCAHDYDPMLGGWFPRTGPHMQTDQPGVFSAGDCAGVAGALVAVEQGALAGLYAAQRVGAMTTWQAGRSAAPSSRRLRSLRRFRRAMDRMYPIHPNLYANMTDQTTVCRCEQVTAGSIRKAVRAGTADLNDIKKRTRAGMGYCQGANCVPPMAAMLHREFNVEEDAVDTMTSRPPAEPVPLRLLVTADGAMNRFGIESDPSHASTDWM